MRLPQDLEVRHQMARDFAEMRREIDFMGEDLYTTFQPQQVAVLLDALELATELLRRHQREVGCGK